MNATETPTPVADITTKINDLHAEWSREKERHSAEVERIKQCIEDANHMREMAIRGVEPQQYELARTVMRIRGDVKMTAEGALEAALIDLARGGHELMEHYIGAKRYASFHQREDHAYGRGPRHGNIVFAVELKPEVRARGSLTPEEREACVRYLIAQAEAAGVKVNR